MLKSIFIVFIFCFFFPCQVYAFSLEQIKVKSSFGEKFYAEIIVSNDGKKGLKVSMGSQQDYAILGIRRPKILDQLRISEPIEFVSINQQLIKIISDKPLFYPSFDLIIKASLGGGTILEKYSMAVDFRKDMALALSPPKSKEKAILQKTVDLPKAITKKKKKEPTPILKEKKPEKRTIISKKTVKKVLIPEKAEKVARIKSGEKGVKKKQEKTVEDKKKKLTGTPTSSGQKLVSTSRKTSTKKLLTYEASPGDSLSRILQKIRPQNTDFFRAVVALWKLNKNQFLYNNINALKVGARLLFANLDEEISRTTPKETARILRNHGVQWENIRHKASKISKEESLVKAIPLPGENIMATNEITGILSKWENSWENNDLKKHFSYYSKDFLSNNYLGKNIGLAGWKRYKTRITNKTKNIKIDIKNIHIRREGNQIIVSFLQKFSSDTLISFGTKTIIFKKTDNQWKITKEEFKKTKDKIVYKKHPYVVHTSSHAKWAVAVQATNRLREAGYAAYLVKSFLPGKGAWFRVVIDRFRTKREAKLLARKLVKKKISKHASVLKLPYAISIGSFKSEEEAYQTLQNFRKKRYSPYLFSAGAGKEVMHHIIVGGYEKKEQVNRISKILTIKEVPHKIILP